MDDGGISVTGLTIGGAALTTLGGLVGAWLKARHSRTEITPQPLVVRAETPSRSCEDCIRIHQEVERRHDDLVAEVRADRRGLAEALGGIREAISDGDRKAEERSRNLHKRIDPLVGAISAATHSIENHLADHRAKNA